MRVVVVDKHEDGNLLGKQDDDEVIECPIWEHPYEGLDQAGIDQHVNKCLVRSLVNTPIKKHIKRNNLESSNGVFKDLMSSSQRKVGPKLTLAHSSNRDLNNNKEKTPKRSTSNTGAKNVPFSKILDCTTISVDAFKYGKILKLMFCPITDGNSSKINRDLI